MDEVRFGSRTLQPGRQLLVNGRREPLGKRALDILSVLAAARGEIVTKDELLDAVWPGVTVEENALQVHIVALRKALGPEAERLRTIRGVGYQLAIDGEAIAPMVETADHAAHASSPPNPGPASSDAQGASGPIVTPAFVWAKAKAHRLAMAVATLLLILVVGWTLFGDNLGLRTQDRIPVVVRTLTASGSGDSTEAALANGVTEELIVRLRRLPDLRIATAEPDGSVPGSEFASAYIVDGSIRSVDERLRVTARLSDSTGEILWSQTFDRRLVDLLEVQERIAASVADALSVSLDVGTDSTAYGGTDEPEAYAAYLQFRATQTNLDQNVPVRYLERALAIDPDYIKALAGLSVSYGLRANFASSRTEALALLAEADKTSARAVAANPELWVGHMARGFYFANSRDFASADRSFERVAALDRGVDPELRANLAGWALNMGRTTKALSLIDSNATIDPVTRLDGRSTWALATSGKYQEAIDQFARQAANESPWLQLSAQHAFWSYLALGREADAIRISEQYSPDFATLLREFKSETALPSMSLTELRRWAAGRYGEGGYGALVNYALFASYSGDPKLSVNLLRVAFERPAGGFGVTAMWFPPMANARKTDDFEQLVTDIGLVKIWRESGDWPDACRPVSAAEISCH